MNVKARDAFFQVRAGVQYRPLEDHVPTYIAFLKWTPQGLQNIKQSPSRLEAVRKGFEAVGVKMKDFYMVTGRYDMVTILEAPDDIALTKAIVFDIAGKHQIGDLSSFLGR